jgi:hypothetical protein
MRALAERNNIKSRNTWIATSPHMDQIFASTIKNFRPDKTAASGDGTSSTHIHILAYG